MNITHQISQTKCIEKDEIDYMYSLFSAFHPNGFLFEKIYSESNTYQKSISEKEYMEFMETGKIFFRFQWIVVTCSNDGLPGPSGGGNIACGSKWSIFLYRLNRTPAMVVENIKKVCTHKGLHLQQLNEFAYCVTPAWKKR